MQDTHTGKWVPPGGESLLNFAEDNYKSVLIKEKLLVRIE